MVTWKHLNYCEPHFRDWGSLGPYRRPADSPHSEDRVVAGACLRPPGSFANRAAWTQFCERCICSVWGWGCCEPLCSEKKAVGAQVPAESDIRRKSMYVLKDLDIPAQWAHHVSRELKPWVVSDQA